MRPPLNGPIRTGPSDPGWDHQGSGPRGDTATVWGKCVHEGHIKMKSQSPPILDKKWPQSWLLSGSREELAHFCRRDIREESESIIWSRGDKQEEMDQWIRPKNQEWVKTVKTLGGLAVRYLKIAYARVAIFAPIRIAVPHVDRPGVIEYIVLV